MTKPSAEEDPDNRIVAVTLDEESIGRSGPDIEHERAIAIYDLVGIPRGDLDMLGGDPVGQRRRGVQARQQYDRAEGLPACDLAARRDRADLVE